MFSERPKEYERQKVDALLLEFVSKPLGIIVAPSGFGKTTAARFFFGRHPEYVNIWLPLGQEEVDEVWVWNRLCEKCGEVNEALYRQLKELGLPESVQEMDYFVRIVRSFLKTPFFFVLDDYHECDSRTINRLITYLAGQDIPNLHILLIGHLYPDIPYSELYLKGYCVLIDQKALALTGEESVEIFRQNGVELTEEEQRSMKEYTDGWIAAVYLLLIDYKRTGRLGRFTNVTHLLKTAIFDKLPEKMQKLCMKMSLFDHFSPEEAAFVTGCEIHPLAMMELADEFGFMQYDVKSGKFEMHTLLRTVASAELDKKGYSREELYRRAAAFNERQGHYIRTIIYYRNAGDTGEIFRILSGEPRYTVFDQAPGILGDIFERTPESVKVKYPAAYLSYIYESILRDSEDKGRGLLAQAKEEFARVYKGKERTEQYERLQGELMILESAAQFNDIEKVTDCMRKAEELLGGETSSIFKKTLLTCGSPQMTMLYQKQAGELMKTVAAEKEYAKYYMHLIAGVDGGWDELFDAEYAFYVGELDRAYELSQTVKEKARFRRQTCIIISSYYMELWCLIYQGKQELFEQRMAEFRKEMYGIARPLLVTDYELAYSGLYVLIGRTDRMSDWIRNFDLAKCSHILRSIRSGCISYAMILSMTGQWTLLDAIAGELLVPFETSRHVYVEICGYLYKAIAAWHLEDGAKAAQYLQKAVALAEPDGLKIPFIERSKELAPIFEETLCRHPFYLSLKPYFKQYQHSLRLFERQKKKVTLTRREMELMELVKAGLRNSEISERMSIALVTVEKSLTNIYRKLEVTNRAAAVARIEEMNIWT